MKNSRILFVDIETVPDSTLIPTDEIDGSLPKPLHNRVVAISLATGRITRDGQGERIRFQECRSGGTENSSEEELLRGFWALIKRERPRVVTWNGRSFDIPVLVQRAFRWGIPISGWFQFEDRWSNYQYRYSDEWHCDLMDTLSSFGSSPRLRLDEAAKAVGLPGKIGNGAGVFADWQAGNIGKIRAYCEIDVLNLTLLYFRWRFVTGKLSRPAYVGAVEEIVEFLEKQSPDNEHFRAFLQGWQPRKGGWLD